jgi:hypothetical protein
MAVHRAYAKNAHMQLPALEEYEKAAMKSKVIRLPVRRWWQGQLVQVRTEAPHNEKPLRWKAIPAVQRVHHPELACHSRVSSASCDEHAVESSGRDFLEDTATIRATAS